ncbi:hypothetical protein D3C72_1537440 [compost metagenome]
MQALAPALAEQHPDQRHRHQHADRVANAETPDGRAPFAGRYAPRERQQGNVAERIERGAQQHDENPGAQAAPVVEDVAAAETAAQDCADTAIAEHQPRRTEQGQGQACRHAAHQHLAGHQGDEPWQRRLAAMDQPKHEAQRRIGVPRGNVQPVHRVDIRGPVKQQIQADKGGIRQVAGQE